MKCFHDGGNKTIQLQISLAKSNLRWIAKVNDQLNEPNKLDELNTDRPT